MSAWMWFKFSIGAIVASTLLPACSGAASREELPAAESELPGSTVETTVAGNDDVCASAGGAGASDWSPPPAKLQVLLTDAPGDFQAVPVSISRVDAYLAQPISAEAGINGADSQLEAVSQANGGSGGEVGSVDAPADDNDAGWIVVVDKPSTYDLLELQNGLTAGMGGAAIPAGHYTQLRVIVSSAAVVIDGQVHNLKIPSGEQSGLKFGAAFDLASGGDYVMTLDFDAQQSVKKVASNYLLTPVISVKSLEAQK